jgi:prepilin peptidase CpaA
MTQPLFLFFPALVVFAGCYDLLARTISNRLCGLIALAFLAVAAWIGMDAAEIARHVSCAAVMLAAGFALFAAGWIGGGDAKLFAAAALWFGWGEIADYTAVSAIIGGGLALGVVGLRVAAHASPLAALLPAPRNELPYGVALALATLVVYPQGQWAAALAG